MKTPCMATEADGTPQDMLHPLMHRGLEWRDMNGVSMRGAMHVVLRAMPVHPRVRAD